MNADRGKADFLITLVGTSAMPNLIGIVSRIKEKGKVYLLHTKDTEDISGNLRKFIIEEAYRKKEKNLKIDAKNIELINYDDPEDVYEEIEVKFKCIKEDIKKCDLLNPVIELNYTGGTKVISSIAYTVFKSMFDNEFNNLNFTYLDGEKSLIKIHGISEKKEVSIPYLNETGTIPLNIIDVLNVHRCDGDTFNFKKNESYTQSKFSQDIFQYILTNNEKRKEIIDYLKKLNDTLNSKEKERKKEYKEKEKFMSFLDKFLEENMLLDSYKDARDLIRAFECTEETLSKSKIQDIIRNITGEWFEEAIHQLLIELKEEQVVDDFISNLSRYKNKAFREMEIDFVAMKNYKMYFFSVSTVESVEKTKFKLYEIKQRAKILSEVESAIATITFVEDREEIIKSYNNIWQEKPKNTLIITWNELPRLKEIIKEWIENKGDIK